MRVFVIGGTGFIGRALARWMSSHELWVTHRGYTAPAVAGPRVLLGNRQDAATLRRHLQAVRPDIVIDMSAMNGADGATVLQAMAGCVERAVLVSSGSVYRSFGVLVGSEPGPIVGEPSREDAPLRHRLYPYLQAQSRPVDDPRAWLDGYDKIPAEQAYLAAHSVSASVLRLPMVYGPGDPAGRLEPYLQRMRDRRSAILLRHTCAAWRNSRSCVDNAAWAIACVALRGVAGRVYNVCEPDDATEKNWIEALGRLYGWPGQVLEVADSEDARYRPSVDELPMQANYAQHLRMDSDRIRAELNYMEPVDRDDVLAACINHFHGLSPRLCDYGPEDELLARLGARS